MLSTGRDKRSTDRRINVASIPHVVRRLLPMGVLYGGRIGIAGLGFVVLPLLSRHMPADQFGLAATILSLQSLAIVLDLGLAVVLASELPAMDCAATRRALVRRSERQLIVTYLIVAAVAAMLSVGGILPASLPVVLMTAVALLAVVWQNIIAVAMIARQQFFASTVSLFLSLLLRQGSSLAFVILYGGTLNAFVAGQVFGAMVVLAISRFAVLAHGQKNEDMPPVINPERKRPRTPTAGINVAVMAYTIAGACALQFDKILLSAAGSPSRTGPYFLASMVSLVPITFLATPITQFVQPKLIAALVHGRIDIAGRWIARLTVAITALAVLPGFILGMLTPWIIPLWLHDAVIRDAVIGYAQLLMPGASLGALGLVPAIVLIARRDYPALAIMSAVLSIGVLSATAVLAKGGNISGICIAYAIYHTLATMCLWVRAWQVEPAFAGAFLIGRRIANYPPHPVDRG